MQNEREEAHLVLFDFGSQWHTQRAGCAHLAPNFVRHKRGNRVACARD